MPSTRFSVLTRFYADFQNILTVEDAETPRKKAVVSYADLKHSDDLSESKKLPNTSSLKYHEHLGVYSHFWQKWENGMWVGRGETPQKQGGTVHF